MRLRITLLIAFVLTIALHGHSIRVEVASTAFPKYDRNLNTGEPLGIRELSRV